VSFVNMLNVTNDALSIWYWFNWFC